MNKTQIYKRILRMFLSSLSHVKRTNTKDKERPAPPSISNVKLIVDRSGSMYSCVEGARAGMRTFLEKMKKMAEEGSEVYLQVITFDDRVEVPFHGKAKDLDKREIQKCISALEPRGTTRLNDTLWEALEKQKLEIKKIEANLPKAYKKLDVKVSGTCAIITDGADNESYRTKEQVRKLVESRSKDGILCQFIASNMDALETGCKYGYTPNNSLQMGNTPEDARHALLAVTSSQERQFSGETTDFTPLERQSSNGGSI